MRPTRHKALTAVVAAALLMAPAAAVAASWTIVPADSRIAFDYMRAGKPAEGRFTRFAGNGTFDPAAPEDATLELRIESASIDLYDTTASAFATSAEWFDSANFPQVTYRLLHLSPEGGDRYRAEGELTIRGKTRMIATTIVLDIDDAAARAVGSLQLDRTDYWLGVGPISLFVDIGREIAVRFDLVARPPP
jgi:polyisoprenoid-binding protein YceI